MIEIRNDTLTKIRGEIRGPPDSPYEGGTYSLDISIPDEYPFQPPIVRFLFLKIFCFHFSNVCMELRRCCKESLIVY